jgi:hypothetical protein
VLVEVRNCQSRAYFHTAFLSSPSSLKAATLQDTEALDFLNHAYVSPGTSLHSDQAWYIPNILVFEEYNKAMYA